MRTARAPVTRDLLSGLPDTGAGVKTLAEGAMLLKGFAAAEAPALLKGLERILAQAPFRHMVTPSGHTMSAAMTN
ncbi:MAG TPA: alpha-ketoglutarate-dependent dioxygenase AlkB, partial [Burkholderiales bacterium]|nr:alpha-ketoglutarate-dependent dioxygenase AlkB [Burkholderiales bacterium]